MSIESREKCLDTLVASAATIQACQRAARRRPAHYLRDLDIFKKVEIEGWTHAEAAAYFKLDRSRITQIIAEVRRHLALAAQDDPEIKDFEARQRLDRELEKMRLQHALDIAARAMRREQNMLLRKRMGSRDKDGSKEGWSETVQQDIKPNMQPVNTYLRASRQLSNLSKREAESQPEDTFINDEDLFTAVFVVLEDWRYGGHDENDPPSNAFLKLVQDFFEAARSWVIRRRSGSSRHDAWPEPKATKSEPLGASGKTSSQIHLGAGEINKGLTMPGGFSDAITPPAQAT
jgi:hypothetical protein